MAFISNTRVVRVEWGHCDPAGIIFYPRYFEFFDASTTELLSKALGMTKYDYLKHYDFAGHPLVATRARFIVPTRFGDDIAIESAITEIKRSSIEIAHRIRKDGQLAVEGFETRVWVARDTADPAAIRSQAIPREVIELLSVD